MESKGTVVAEWSIRIGIRLAFYEFQSQSNSEIVIESSKTHSGSGGVRNLLHVSGRNGKISF
jgi:hypothetical protein